MIKRLPYCLTILVSFLLIFLAGYWFLVLPQFRTLGSVLAQGQQAEAASQPIKLTQADRTARSTQITTLTNQAEDLLPHADKQYDLSVQLEAAAKNSGVSLTAMSITGAQSSSPKTTSGAAASGGPVQKLTISLSATGTYGAVQTWVTTITSLDRFMQIDQVSLTGSPTTDQVSAQVSAFAYYLP